MEPTKIESGLQFLARIKTSPTFQNFDNTLFPNGLIESATIELSGNLSSGKTLLLYQIIAKCILPTEYNSKNIGGLGTSVILINTNHNFLITKLRSFIVTFLYKNQVPDLNPVTIDHIIKRSLNNLIIINCYSSLQFFTTVENLHHILLNNRNISLIAIDGIASYYWEDRKNGGEWLITRYIQKILKAAQRHTHQWNIRLIYTREKDSSFKEKNNIACVQRLIPGGINSRIELKHFEKENKFLCIVESNDNAINQINYTIGSNGIEWIKSELIN